MNTFLIFKLHNCTIAQLHNCLNAQLHELSLKHTGSGVLCVFGMTAALTQVLSPRLIRWVQKKPLSLGGHTFVNFKSNL